MKTIYFVTGNTGKIESVRKYFVDTDINVEVYKIDAEEPNVNDIEFIAKYKVMNAYDMLHKPCIALDAGFYINNFPDNPGFPGAFPKRELLEPIDRGIEWLLEKMKNVQDRTCYFKECLAFYDGQKITYFYGLSEGTLATSIRGLERKEKWSDLWYVFIPKNHVYTLAEMDEEERNNRRDGHTSAYGEFTKQYVKKRC